MTGARARSAVGALAIAAAGACDEPPRHPIVPDGSAIVTVMDFAEPFSLDPLPDGWSHGTFWRHGPMTMAFATKNGVPALRLDTHDTASMLFRHVDVPLDRYPSLRWRWLVEDGIDTDTDELTREGDDHPVRFFVVFRSAADERRAMEIIWGNRSLGAGDYKDIGGFPHYVANGGRANQGRWHEETVSLASIYERLWGDAAGARLVDLGIFCDSDETGDPTTAYVADVHVMRDGEG